MKYSIVSRLEILESKYKIIQKKMLNKKIFKNKKKIKNFSKKYLELSNIVYYFQLWKKIKQDIKSTKELLVDSEIKIMAEEELIICRRKIRKIEKKIKVLLLPKNLDDEKNCFLEIRSGTGGNESAIFAGDLFKMYNRYSEFKNWDVEIMNYSVGEFGGFKEIILKISGKNVYEKLKFESGGHRVQRVPNTESQGRIHTSTCTVAVLPEATVEESKNISFSDIRIDTFRSSGSGGQHVNTTNSAIRLTHIPTGIVVECQDERSQHKNKAKAFSVLVARIRSIQLKKQSDLESLERRNLLGSGERSDRIRTYNFPQSRVSDHRINLTIYRLDEIMEGKLDYLIGPIVDKYREKRFSIFLKEKS